MAVQKLAIVQALNHARLAGSDRGASAIGLIIDVLIDRDDTVTLILVDRTGGPQGTPVPADWVAALRTAAASVPGVRGVRVEQKPAGSVAPSVQQAAGRQRPIVDLGSTRVLSVASGKGGVGKSTVTANLAAALVAAGRRVAAVDADIYGFSLPSLLGVTEGPGVTPEKRLVPARAPSGVELLSMDFFVPGNQPVIWRGPMLGKALHQFLADAEWDGVDYLLLDLPPGTGDVALDVHEMLPTSRELVVTTPDPLAARVAVRAGQMAQKTGHTVVGVIENMSFLRCPHCAAAQHPFGQGGGEQVAAALAAPLLGRLPLGETPQQGTGLFAPETETGRVFRQIADRILATDGAGATRPTAAGG